MYLRRDVGECSAGGIHLLLGQDHLRETEVCDLEVLELLAAENVLWLEVAVNDAQVMEVRHRLEQRPEQLGGLKFGEARPAHDALEELAALEHLHDDVQVLLGLVQALHADDIRVVHQLQHGDLGAQQPLFLGLDGALVDDLHGGVLPRGLVHTLAHHREPASSQLLADDVVVLDRHHVRRVLQRRHPLVAQLLRPAVQDSLVVSVMLARAQVLV